MHQIRSTEYEISFIGNCAAMHIRCAALFHERQRGLCREIAAALLEQPGIGKAHIDLDKECLQVHFTAGAGNPGQCGNTVAAAIQSALSAWSRNKRKPVSLPAQRKQWTALTAYSAGLQPSLWETFRGNNPGRAYIQHPSRPLNRHERMLLGGRLLRQAGISKCQASPWWSDHLEVEYDPARLDLSQIIDQAEQIRTSLQKKPEKTEASALMLQKRTARTTQPSIPAPAGTERFRFFIKAGASFTMTIIGLIVPGIPTLPFLVLTSYYLARCSPWLHAKLLKSRFFGDILRDWEQDFALTRASKEKLSILLAVVVCATLLTMPATPVSWMLIALSAAISLYGIRRMPDELGPAQGCLENEQPA